MRNTLRAFLLLAALPLVAADIEFGEAFPLTNVRYGPANAKAHRLVSDGRDLYLFWSTTETIYMTRLGARPEIGRKVMEPVTIDTGRGTDWDEYFGELDVVWNGTEFVIAAYAFALDQDSFDGNENYIFLGSVDRSGNPVRLPSSIVASESPRLASNGSTAFLLYLSAGSVVARPLTNGAPGSPTEIVATSVAKGLANPAAVAGGADGFLAVVRDMAFRFDASGRFVSATPRPEMPRRARTTLASNGRDYLAAWCEFSFCGAAMLDGNGALRHAIELPPGDENDPAPRAIWNGDGWTIAYARSVVTLNADATHIVAHDEAAFGTQLALAGDGRVVAAWGPVPDNPAPVVVAEVGETDASMATYAANEQTLLATTSSAEATIVLWLERAALRAGLRSRFGDWHEREIARDAIGALVETDGNEFVVVVNREGLPSTAMAIGNDGRRRWSARLPVAASAIVWTGQAYAIAGTTETSTAMLRLTRDGIAGRPVDILDFRATDLRLATSGSGFMLGFVDGTAYAGRRLNAAFGTLDAFDFTPHDPLLHSPGLIWNGARYIATWIGADGIMSAYADSSGGRPSAPHMVISWNATSLAEATPVRTRDGAAIVWRGVTTENVVLLTPLGHNAKRLFTTVQPPKRLRLTTLPDGRLAFVRTAVVEPGAREGRGRVSMSIADLPRPTAPEAPTVTVSAVGNVYLVTWSQPDKNVNGYRLEYRAGDGVWVELERWFDAHERSASITGVEGVQYSFRVRGFNDGGASD